MARPWKLALLLILSAAGLPCVPGCWVAYRPAGPHEAWSEETRARLVSVDTFARIVSVSVALEAPSGHRIGDAWLTAASAAPCAGGVPAGAQHPGALRADQRSFEFDVDGVTGVGLLGEVPTAIDLDVVPADLHGVRRCLRVPLTGATHAVEWRAYPRWFIATGLRVLGAPASGGAIEGGGLFSVGGGMWVGPVRLRLDWLVGEAGTNRPPPAGYAKLRAELLGGAAAAEIFPLRRGAWGIGLQLGYEYLATDFNATAGSSSADAYAWRGPQGPRAALRLARLPWPRGWPEFRARPDSWSMGIDLFAARWYGLDGLAPMHYGIALGGEWGRWW